MPDAVGDTATFDTTGKSSATTTQDFTGNRTVGKLEVTGSGNASWTISLASGKNLVMNQDGAGPLQAIISNTQTNATGGNPTLIISPNTGILILNDDLLISNTGASTRTSGSIQIDASIQGTGNITYYNVSNDIGHGQIALFRTSPTGSAYSGNTTIAKGAVVYNRGDRFTPNANLFITLGSAGNGDATLVYTGGVLNNQENSFIVAGGTGGTTVFGATTAGLVNIKSSGAGGQRLSDWDLQGDITYNAANASTVLQIGGVIKNVGKVTKIGPGALRLLSTNTFSGGLVVNAGSVAVGHVDQFTNCCGTYPATDGTLGYGDITVTSAATKVEIETLLNSVNVIADNATLTLAGGGGAGTADVGYLQLDDALTNETVGALVLGGVFQAPGTYGSTSATGATHQSDEYFSGPGMITVLRNPDLNGDNAVNAADYVTYRENDGTDAGYVAFRHNFNYPTTPAAPSLMDAAAVPEPGALLLLVAGCLLAIAGGRRR
jgi:autotransporter-associated beta strand protein